MLTRHLDLDEYEAMEAEGFDGMARVAAETQPTADEKRRPVIVVDPWGNELLTVEPVTYEVDLRTLLEEERMPIDYPTFVGDLIGG